MKTRVLWGILLFVAAITVAGCSSSGGGGDSDSGRIRARYSQLARATERENIGDVMSVFSPNYYDGGYDYVDIRNVYAERFDMLENIGDSYTIQSLRVDGNFATVQVIERLEGDNVFKPGAPREYWETPLTDIWRYENGDWYIYGDQANPVGLAKKSLRLSPKGRTDGISIPK